MTIHFTKEFQKEIGRIKSSRVKGKLQKQLKLFIIDQKHPSLKLHKLKGKRSQQYSIWIEDNLRAIAVRDNDTYVFFDLVNHDEY